MQSIKRNLPSLIRHQLRFNFINTLHTNTQQVPSSSPKNDKVEELARHVMKTLTPNPNLSQILKSVWENDTVTSVCPNLVIRLTTLRGEVSRAIWRNHGGNPLDIQLLAVGSVDAPTHLPKYREFLNSFYHRTSQLLLEDQINNYKIGYDLLSRGTPEARRSVLELFNRHYGFPEDVLEKCISNSAITAGGMRGLKDIADALLHDAKKNNSTHTYIQPDNSFGTWWNIIEKDKDIESSYGRRIVTITTQPKNLLHITAYDVNNYYKENKPSKHESWYITPVGNPSGTKITPQDLLQSCQAIVQNNPDAVIILDTVYVRTVPTQHSIRLLSEIVNDEKMLKQIIFVESFSKSHGLCGERLGIYFAPNEALFTRLHSANIAYSAGPGRIKDYQFQALGDAGHQHWDGVEELHRFWQQERKGLYKFLMQDKYKHLFDRNQEHITEEDIDNPLGLYLLLKVNSGVGSQLVFSETGALGVEVPIASGKYIRFSLGSVTSPVYSKLALV